MAGELKNVCYINPDRRQVDDMRGRTIEGFRFILCDRDPERAISALSSPAAEAGKQIHLCELRLAYPTSTMTVVEIITAIRDILPDVKLLIGLEPIVPEIVRTLMAHGADGLFRLNDLGWHAIAAMYRSVLAGKKAADEAVWETLTLRVPHFTQRLLDVAWGMVNHPGLIADAVRELLPNGPMSLHNFNGKVHEMTDLVRSIYGPDINLRLYLKNIAQPRLGCVDPKRGKWAFESWLDAEFVQRSDWTLIRAMD
ncbi:MAG: hypothetical protein U1E73_02000 [Planctomycetota bacterium]